MKRPVDRGRTDPACIAAWHGTDSAYRHGCRCPEAREERRIHDKRRRQGRATPAYIDGCGTARRIQALAVMGWRYGDVGRHLGTSWQFVQKLADRDNPTCSRTTARNVAAVYRHLVGIPGPSEPTRQRALKKGWAGPGAWGDDIDDPTAQPDLGDDRACEPDDYIDAVRVEQVIAGERPFAELRNDAERAEVVGELMRRGHHREHISRTYGLGHNRIRRLATLAGVPGYEREQAA